MGTYSDITLSESQVVLERYVAGTAAFEALLGFFKGDWSPSTFYNVNDMVRNENNDHIWLCTTSHTSGVTFDQTKWGTLLSLSPFQAIAGAISVSVQDLDERIEAAASAEDSLSVKIAQAENTVLGTISAEQMAEIVEDVEAATRPSALVAGDTADLTGAVIAIDQGPWNAPLQISLALAISALGGGFTDADEDSKAYGRKDGAWIEVSEATHNHSLDDLNEVSAASPAAGQVLTWDDVNDVWSAEDPTGGGAVEDLSDVDIATLTDGQILVWNVGTSKWENQNPSATAAQTSLAYAATPTIDGPATHIFASGDAGVLTLVDLTAGDVEVKFDGTVTTPADEVLIAYFRTINRVEGNDLIFSIDDAGASGGTPTAPTVQSTNASSGAGGTAIAAVETGTITVSCGVGNNWAVAFVCFMNPADVNVRTTSTFINLNVAGGGAADVGWTSKLDGAAELSSAPRVAVKFVPVGDVPSGTVTVVGKAKFEDMGGAVHANLNSYIFFAIKMENVEQTQLYESLSVTRTGTAVATKNVSLNSNGQNRRAVYFVAKRSNATDLAITVSGATQVFENQTGSSNGSAEMRLSISHEEAISGANGYTFTLPQSQTFAEVNFMLLPDATDLPVIEATDNAEPKVTRNNKTVGVMYDGNSSPKKIMLDI